MLCDIQVFKNQKTDFKRLDKQGLSLYNVKQDGTEELETKKLVLKQHSSLKFH